MFALGKQPNPFVLHEGGEKTLYIKNCTDSANSYRIRKRVAVSSGVTLTVILNLQCATVILEIQKPGEAVEDKKYFPIWIKIHY